MDTIYAVNHRTSRAPWMCFHDFFLKNPVLSTLPSSQTTIKCGTCPVIVNDKSLVASFKMVPASYLKKYLTYAHQIWYTEAPGHGEDEV